MNKITAMTPNKPAKAVRLNASCPYCAETTLDEISVSLTGKEPELIKSLSVVASFSVKRPWIIQSP